jgi:hypothetical protein
MNTYISLATRPEMEKGRKETDKVNIKVKAKLSLSFD